MCWTEMVLVDSEAIAEIDSILDRRGVTTR